MTDQIYWNPVLETLPREKIRQLQLKKFKKIFKWTHEHSKFHRKIYDHAGVKPVDIRSFEDIRRVPSVEKSMMRDIQRKDPFPYGDALCVPLEEVTVFRDEFGVPHVYAKNEQDLYRAVGFLMAQDRLWQMDLLRRVTQGKLSEILGKDQLNTDLLMRSLRIQEKSEKILANADPEIVNTLKVFSEGIQRPGVSMTI